MKALKISVSNYMSSYYLFPENYESAGEFISHINDNAGKYHRIVKLSKKSCFPYFIEEDSKDVYLRFDSSLEIEVVDVKLIKRDEYIERLIAVVKTVCADCVSYSDTSETNGEIGNLRGHWSQINLDGYCESYRKKRPGDDTDYYSVCE